MYDEQFRKVVAHTLVWEGGFVDDPADPGGRTNFGITQKEYNAYRTEKGLPTQDVKEIHNDEVIDIYYTRYYLAVHSDLFKTDIAVRWKVFDIGVNMGVNRALKFVQSCINAVPDGQFGPHSESALVQYQQNPDWGHTMMDSLVKQQTDRYNYLVTVNSKLAKFLKGWLKRAADRGAGLA